MKRKVKPIYTFELKCLLSIKRTSIMRCYWQAKRIFKIPPTKMG